MNIGAQDNNIDCLNFFSQHIQNAHVDLTLFNKMGNSDIETSIIYRAINLATLRSAPVLKPAILLLLASEEPKSNLYRIPQDILNNIAIKIFRLNRDDYLNTLHVSMPLFKGLIEMKRVEEFKKFEHVDRKENSPLTIPLSKKSIMARLLGSQIDYMV